VKAVLNGACVRWTPPVFSEERLQSRGTGVRNIYTSTLTELFDAIYRAKIFVENQASRSTYMHKTSSY